MNLQGQEIVSYRIEYNFSEFYTQKDYIDNELMIMYHLKKKDLKDMSFAEYQEKINHLTYKNREDSIKEEVANKIKQI